MKTKIHIAFLAAIIGPLAFWSICFAASEFSGPQPVGNSYKNAKTPDSMLAWYDSDHREWLRIQGNDAAATQSEQWNPHVVSIESTREPQVAKTLTGWIIVFK